MARKKVTKKKVVEPATKTLTDYEMLKIDFLTKK